MANKVTKQFIKAMRADPVFYRLACEAITKQQASKPKNADDLRQIVMAKAVARILGKV